jgi:hypothetical protein
MLSVNDVNRYQGKKHITEYIEPETNRVCISGVHRSAIGNFAISERNSKQPQTCQKDKNTKNIYAQLFFERIHFLPPARLTDASIGLII